MRRDSRRNLKTPLSVPPPSNDVDALMGESDECLPCLASEVVEQPTDSGNGELQDLQPPQTCCVMWK